MPDLDFPYRIKRSRRKTAAIHVTPNGVEVRIPEHVNDRFATEFLRGKQDWVRRKLLQQAEQSALVPKLDIGTIVYWHGKEKRLINQYGPRWKAFVQDELMIIEGPCSPNKKHIQSCLESLFKQQAQRILPSLTAHVAQKLSLENKLTGVKFRRTKSKWGHCTSSGVIQFNWLIMGAPEDVMYYLVCHEVCHLKHHHHGKSFWRLLESICPHVKESEHWLKENGLCLDWMH